MNAGAGRVRSILAGVLLPGLLLVMGPGCERSTEPADGLLLKTRPSFNLGDTLTLAYGEAAENAPTRTVIRFDSVLEDSRCPTHVVCVWEGNARIALDLQEPGGEHRFPSPPTDRSQPIRRLHLRYPEETRVIIS